MAVRVFLGVFLYGKEENVKRKIVSLKRTRRQDVMVIKEG